MMTYEQYLEFDKLMWKNKNPFKPVKPTKKLEKLMSEWEKLPKNIKEEYIGRKNKETR